MTDYWHARRQTLSDEELADIEIIPSPGKVKTCPIERQKQLEKLIRMHRIESALTTEEKAQYAPRRD